MYLTVDTCCMFPLYVPLLGIQDKEEKRQPGRCICLLTFAQNEPNGRGNTSIQYVQLYMFLAIPLSLCRRDRCHKNLQKAERKHRMK